MNKTITGLRDKMISDLHRVNNKNDYPSLKMAELYFSKAVKHLSALKANLEKISFDRKPEQIFFFKKLQPQFFQEILYYYKIIELERLKPKGSFSYQKQFYLTELSQINQYLDSHEFLYLYYTLGKNYLDDILFTLPSVDLTVYPKEEQYHYTEYFNFYSFIIAKLQAYERLQATLKQRIKDQQYNAGKNQPDKKSAHNLTRNNIASGTSMSAAKAEREETLKKIAWLESRQDFSINGWMDRLLPVLNRKRKGLLLLEALSTNARLPPNR